MTRGPQRYKFTLAQLAEVLCMQEHDVRLAKRRGEFDPSNIASVLDWALARTVTNRLQTMRKA